jgi:ATP-dependent DNA helicase DinG
MDVLPVRATRERACDEADVADAMAALADALVQLAAALAPLREASPGLDACHARAVDLAARLARWNGAPDGGDRDGEAGTDEAGDGGPGDGGPGGTDATTRPGPASSDVFWFELTPRGFRLQRTPLDVSGPLREHREKSRASWVFTSATLAVAGGFDHLSTRLGLDQPRTLLEPSPFDWDTQALCYLPSGLPEPMSRGYTDAIVDAIRPVLRASGGRAFVLFASHRALREAAEALRGGPWPLFVQGDAPRAQLLQRFRESGNGVLLGAASFREGVDVAGDALSVVVVDKLPFAAPDDPVFEARLQAVRRAGGNPFMDEQLPQAAIALKQGVGRLIRTENDRGVLVLCDPRLTGRAYGRVFLESLPPFPATRSLSEVEAFFAAADACSASVSATLSRR